MSELTQKLVKQLFDYHEDGYLIRKINSRQTTIGNKAGYLNKHKKVGDRNCVNFGGKKYLSSRIIFLWHHGYLPPVVDHEDRDSTNDKIKNLRPADFSKNQRNRTSSKNSLSQYLGVSMSKRKYWSASIRSNKILIRLGSFKTEIEAALAYNKAAVKHHGEFANLNIININS